MVARFKDDIDKAGGKRAYPASLNEARLWKGFAAAASKKFGYGGITLTHGECDAANTAYGAGLYRFWQDYNTDLKAITGQQQDVVLLVSQQSTIATGATIAHHHPGPVSAPSRRVSSPLRKFLQQTRITI